MSNVIKINIKKKEDYVSKFNDNILSKELSNYIIEECREVYLKRNIDIEITSNYDMDDLEKDKLINMIRTNFKSEISEMLFYRKKDIVIDFFTCGFGILALVFYLFSTDIPVLSEFILVFSWILIWESVYDLIFRKITNKIDIEKIKKLIKCKIIFK